MEKQKPTPHENDTISESKITKNPSIEPKFNLEGFEGISKDDLTNEIGSFKNEAFDQFDILIARPANQWLEIAKKRSIPKMLFSEFWFQGELCILFADTNMGKSILAVQIADSISRGLNIPGFKLEVAKQKVLYFDFELTDKQFENRYSIDYSDHFSFDDNLLRVELNPDILIEESFDDLLISKIEDKVSQLEVKILVIDNITYLKNETEKAKVALPLMQKLNQLKKKYQLSILILAHTPKRDSTRPISINDIQGSKMIANFIDSCLAIGQSHIDNRIRYLKQIKQRNVEQIYDAENICLCQISKPGNFLQFEFLSFDIERKHLKQANEDDRQTRLVEVNRLKAEGVTNIDIARKFGVSEGCIRKWLKNVSK